MFRSGDICFKLHELVLKRIKSYYFFYNIYRVHTALNDSNDYFLLGKPVSLNAHVKKPQKKPSCSNALNILYTSAEPDGSFQTSKRKEIPHCALWAHGTIKMKKGSV